jgi:glycosyltransferase involved in cell wall biosynthesis
MRIAFIDIATAYTADQPEQESLGGTQSAVCYLARALAKKDVQVTLINQHRAGGTHEGVMSLSPDQLDNADILKSFDALIVNGRWTEKLVQSFKEKSGKPIIAWMHEAMLEAPWTLPLSTFSAFVFVSQWQQKLNAAKIPASSKTISISNGVAPSFQKLFPELNSPPLEGGVRGGVLAAKAPFPLCMYAGSSKRGLLHLLDIIPSLHKAWPELRFEIYSACVMGSEAETTLLKARLKTLPGVTHVGAVDQRQCAAAFKRAHFLLSPNPYPETFCIVLAEAMAAGLTCITTARAALPETAAGFATLIPVKNPDAAVYAPENLDAQAFAAAALARMKDEWAKPGPAREEALRAQMAYAHTHYDWDKHAEKWVEFLQTL